MGSGWKGEGEGSLITPLGQYKNKSLALEKPKQSLTFPTRDLVTSCHFFLGI